MTFETDVKTTLATVATRVYPDFAPVSTTRPYVTYQLIGGSVLNPLDGSAPGVRFPELQVNVWASTRIEAMSLIRSIETAMRAATAFECRPLSEPVGDFDADVPVYAARQDFACRY